jgi:hypothetical protein
VIRYVFVVVVLVAISAVAIFEIYILSCHNMAVRNNH